MSARTSARNSAIDGQTRPARCSTQRVSQSVWQMIVSSDMMPLRSLDENILTVGSDIESHRRAPKGFGYTFGYSPRPIRAEDGNAKERPAPYSRKGTGRSVCVVPPIGIEPTTFGTGNQRLGVFWEQIGAKTHGITREYRFGDITKYTPVGYSARLQRGVEW